MITFHSPHSGALRVRRQGEVLVLDFPAYASTPCVAGDAGARALGPALGKEPSEVRMSESKRYLAVFERGEDVQALIPDLTALAQVGTPVIATAPGADGVDSVSRFFAPTLGVPEDPVTGSAHCVLIPYWAERLGKTELQARQVSARGGELVVALRGNRVECAEELRRAGGTSPPGPRASLAMVGVGPTAHRSLLALPLTSRRRG